MKKSRRVGRRFLEVGGGSPSRGRHAKRRAKWFDSALKDPGWLSVRPAALRGMLACVIVGAAALSFNVLEAVPAASASGTLSSWLAMDGSIQYVANSTLHNQFGWGNEDSGTANLCGGVSAVNVPGTHGLFNCGSPGATGFEPDAALNANGDGSIISRAFIPDPSLGQDTTGCGTGSADATSYHGGQTWGTQNSYVTTQAKVNPAKDDLSDAYIVARRQQTGNNYDPSPGDREVFFGLERADSGGDVGLSLEFLQNPAAGMQGCSGPLAMPRSQGDFALDFGWTVGGDVAINSIDIWECNPGGTAPPVGTSCNPGLPLSMFPNAGYVSSTPPAGSVKVAENTSAAIPCGGWVCAENPLPATQFIEGGIDLNGIGVNTTCSGTVIASSRSSQSDTADLQDFVGGTFDLCPPTTTATTPVVPTPATIGSAWSDTATVTGTTANGAPTGTVAFFSCSPTQLAAAGGTTCSDTIGTLIGSSGSIANPVPLTPGTGITSTATSPPITPPAIGTWCFAAYYSGETGVYDPSSDTSSNECFAVGAATPTTATTAGTLDSSGAITDQATISGNAFAGLPSGSVAFYVCKASSAAGALCTTSDTLVSTNPATGTGSTTTATSGAFTPTSIGTWCFGAVFTPTNTNYTASSDNITPPVNGSSDTVDTNECFTATKAPNFTVTKTDVPTSGTSVAPNSTIVYTVVVQNVGNAVGMATVTDTIPSNLTIQGTPTCVVTAPDTCTVANPSGSTWTFTVDLAAGNRATVTFSATVAASATGNIVNTATITSGPCTTSSGCSSTVTNPVLTAPVTSPSTVTPPASPVAAAAPVTSPTPLAVTGAEVAGAVAAGLALLALGGSLVLLSRRLKQTGDGQIAE